MCLIRFLFNIILCVCLYVIEWLWFLDVYFLPNVSRHLTNSLSCSASWSAIMHPVKNSVPKQFALKTSGGRISISIIFRGGCQKKTMLISMLGCIGKKDEEKCKKTAPCFFKNVGVSRRDLKMPPQKSAKTKIKGKQKHTESITQTMASLVCFWRGFWARCRFHTLLLNASVWIFVLWWLMLLCI